MKSLLLAATSTLFISCGKNVYVVDQDGNPLERAQVRPQTRSYNKPPLYTDKNGGVTVIKDVPPIEYLHVAKVGYHSPDPVNFQLPKPITVVLTKKQ